MDYSLQNHPDLEAGGMMEIHIIDLACRISLQ